MKKVNMQDLFDKLTMVYGDECEKNVVGMIIYEKSGKFFFDQDFKYSMNSEEMEALLIRGAVINKDGVFHSPTSFDSTGVAFGGGGESFIPTTSNSSECYCIKNAVFFGDSITHGVYSYYNNGKRMNGFDQTDDTYLRIPAYFGEIAGCDVTNNGKRGSGWVQDTRRLGNGLEMTRQTDFANYDFAAYCLGINDWIQGAPLGSLTDAQTVESQVTVVSETDTDTIIEVIEGSNTPIETTLSQGFASTEFNHTLATRVKTGYIRAPYHIEVNEGYRIRAIYCYDSNDESVTGRYVVKDTSTTATMYDIMEKTDKWHVITFAKANDTANISPDEDIIKELYALDITRVTVTGGAIAGTEPIITELVNGAGNSTANKPDIIQYNHRLDRVRTEFIQAPFHVEVNNGYNIRAVVAYTHNDYTSGSSKILTTGTTYESFTVSQVDVGYPYYMVTFTKTDAAATISPGEEIIKKLYNPVGGDSGNVNPPVDDDIKEGTVVSNMRLCFRQIAQQNPLCKIVVYSPYNSWGQVSAGGDYVSDVYYGDESTNYALGVKNKAGYTLQELIDTIDEVCKHYGIAHVPLSQSNICNRLTIKDIMIDGLHPSREARPFLAAEIFGKKEFDR